MNIEQYGYNDKIAALCEEYRNAGLFPARVCVVHKGLYILASELGELTGEVSGKFSYNARFEGDYPAVGDWVIIKVMLEEKKAIIQSVLPRKTKFSRKVSGSKTSEQIIAANIDYVFIVSSLNDNFNLERIERYLVMAWESGASPVVILSKADLCGEVSAKVREAEKVAVGIPIHAVSIVSGDGLDELKQYCRNGITIALLGSSGVGKSTLTNYFMGTEKQAVQDISEKHDKGRHTTTHRELIVLPEGGVMIDSPGMRELQLWENEQGFNDTFEYIGKIARQCQFADCKHITEPGCAVLAASKNGTLDRKRYENYKKLQKENQYLKKKLDYLLRFEEKREKGKGKRAQRAAVKAKSH